MRTIILGAGITGLAAGYGKDIPIYEATGEAGGICRSYMKNGFDFSIGGGHWLFENDKTQKAMEFIRSLVELKSYDRRAGVFYNKIFPYPIQTYTQQPIVATGGCFKHWMGNRFSQAECNMFFFPFNEKYTAGLMDEIVQFDSYKTPPAGSVGFVSRFHDPVGGLSSLVDKMVEKCDIQYNKRAFLVDSDNKTVVFEDGETVQYDRLISTVPLNRMLKLCGQDKFDLPYSSVFVLNIGAEPGPNLPDEHWLYIPFCNSGFYRVGFYTNVNPNKAPKGAVGLSVEMAVLPGKELEVESTVDAIVKELQSWGWIGEVITTDPTFVKTAYTWNRTMEEREKHIEWMRARDIIMLGRYGRWVFCGMMESIEQGLSIN